jgi:hypothetical protein
LNLKCDLLVSKLAFKFINLYRYVTGEHERMFGAFRLIHVPLDQDFPTEAQVRERKTGEERRRERERREEEERARRESGVGSAAAAQ